MQKKFNVPATAAAATSSVAAQYISFRFLGHLNIYVI